MKKTSMSQTQILKVIILAIVFLSLTCLLYLGFRQDEQLSYNSQKLVFSLGLGALLAGIATLLLNVQMEENGGIILSCPGCWDLAACRLPMFIWACGLWANAAL